MQGYDLEVLVGNRHAEVVRRLDSACLDFDGSCPPVGQLHDNFRSFLGDQKFIIHSSGARLIGVVHAGSSSSVRLASVVRSQTAEHDMERTR